MGETYTETIGTIRNMAQLIQGELNRTLVGKKFNSEHFQELVNATTSLVVKWLDAYQVEQGGRECNSLKINQVQGQIHDYMNVWLHNEIPQPIYIPVQSAKGIETFCFSLNINRDCDQDPPVPEPEDPTMVGLDEARVKMGIPENSSVAAIPKAIPIIMPPNIDQKKMQEDLEKLATEILGGANPDNVNEKQAEFEAKAKEYVESLGCTVPEMRPDQVLDKVIKDGASMKHQLALSKYPAQCAEAYAVPNAVYLLSEGELLKFAFKAAQMLGEDLTKELNKENAEEAFKVFELACMLHATASAYEALMRLVMKLGFCRGENGLIATKVLPDGRVGIICTCGKCPHAGDVPQ
jgi:hypothetical protein